MLKNKTEKRVSSQRKLTMAVSVLAAVALLLTGTFAWTDFEQHKTNVLAGGAKPVSEDRTSVTLIDEFAAPAQGDWEVGKAYDKKLSVTNTSEDEESLGVLVRLQIKEFMDARVPKETWEPIKEGETVLLFATWAADDAASGAKKGEYMKWKDVPKDEESGEPLLKYEKYDLMGLVENEAGEMVEGVIESYALTTNAELSNGVYGKPMYISKFTPSEDGKIWGNKDDVAPAQLTPGSETPHVPQDPGVPECDYTVYKWDGKGASAWENGVNNPDDVIHDYITFDADFITMKEFIDGKKDPGPFWIVDTDDGWVYWGELLKPTDSTDDLITAVTVDVAPGETFTYYMHIDMEAVDLADVDKFYISEKAEEEGGADTSVSENTAAFLDLFWKNTINEDNLAAGDLELLKVTLSPDTKAAELATRGNYSLVQIIMEDMDEETFYTNPEAALATYWAGLLAKVDLGVMNSNAASCLGTAGETKINPSAISTPTTEATATDNPFFFLSEAEALSLFSNQVGSTADAKALFQGHWRDADGEPHEPLAATGDYVQFLLRTPKGGKQNVMMVLTEDDGGTLKVTGESAFEAFSLAELTETAAAGEHENYPSAFLWVKTDTFRAATETV